jgi:hypothetical protein
VDLIGAGRDCVTIKFPAATVLSAPVFNIGVAGFKTTISGITFDLANATTPGVLAVISANTHRLDVVDSAFINGSDHMYFIGAVGQIDGFNISRNIFSSNSVADIAGQGCILVTTAATNFSQNGIIAHNQAKNCGMAITGHDIIIDANTFSSWPTQGQAINVEAYAETYNITITNNNAHGSAGGGSLACLEVWGKNTLIANNQLHECAGGGIDIGGQNSVITGNIIWENGVSTGASPGITIRYQDATYNANGTFIEGNTIFDGGGGTQKYAIADQGDFGGGAGCGAQICSAIFGDNRLSGVLGPVQIRTTGDSYSANASVVNGGTTTGSANAHVLAAVTNPAIIPSNFVRGLTLQFVPGFSNSGATTLNVKTGIAAGIADLYSVPTKSTGVIAINKLSAGSLVALAGGELLANMPTSVTYNGAVWVWGPR